MTIANVTLNDTFDEWRTKTNQLITLYDETNFLARSSYNATNLSVATAANVAANILITNTIYTNIIYTATNTALPIVLTSNTLLGATIGAYVNTAANNFLSNSNLALAWRGANTAQTVANLAFNKANTAGYIANLAYDKANTGGGGGGGTGVGGYFVGNDGRVGAANTVNNIFRITTPYLNNNVYFSTAENSFAVGPIYLDANASITINTGARVVII